MFHTYLDHKQNNARHRIDWTLHRPTRPQAPASLNPSNRIEIIQPCRCNLLFNNYRNKFTAGNTLRFSSCTTTTKRTTRSFLQRFAIVWTNRASPPNLQPPTIHLDPTECDRALDLLSDQQPLAHSTLSEKYFLYFIKKMKQGSERLQKEKVTRNDCRGQRGEEQDDAKKRRIQ